MILLLGGTSESLAVADLLNRRHLSFILSVVSDYGAKLAKQHAQQVVKTAFTPQNLPSYCRQHGISLILDATHPFAAAISKLAIAAANELNIFYLRFERQETYDEKAVVKKVTSFTAAYQYLAKRPGLIYLSTGSETAPDFAEHLGVRRLHVRILPAVNSIRNVTAAGFLPLQIDAIQGPFSVSLNAELFKHANAKAVVTKDSGRRGGVQEKIDACQRLHIPCIIIQRPQINYPQVVDSLKKLAAYLEAKNER